MIYNYRLRPGPARQSAALNDAVGRAASGGRARLRASGEGTAASLVGALLAVFIVAISLNLLRGNAIDCGAGASIVADAGKSVEERFRDMRFVILRDVGMLLLVAAGAPRGDPCGGGAGALAQCCHRSEIRL